MTMDEVFPMHVVDTATWERMYTLSIREARFPMPAIRTEVKFWTRCIAIVSYSHTSKEGVQYFKIHKEWRC